MVSLSNHVSEGGLFTFYCFFGRCPSLIPQTTAGHKKRENTQGPGRSGVRFAPVLVCRLIKWLWTDCAPAYPERSRRTAALHVPNAKTGKPWFHRESSVAAASSEVYLRKVDFESNGPSEGRLNGGRVQEVIHLGKVERAIEEPPCQGRFPAPQPPFSPAFAPLHRGAGNFPFAILHFLC